jgi:MYXO-CTERM domain-containing protein
VRITDTADPAITDTAGPFELASTSGPTTIIPMGSTWEYLDDGTDPGAAWRTATGGWMSGPAQLGYGDGDEATVLRDEDPNVPSALFRQAVNVTGRVTAARIRILLDDAAVVWINDQEVFAHNIGERSPGAYASASSEDNEIHMVELDLGATNPFVVGQNLVAVMVKQEGEGSSDLSFDFELIVETEVMLPDGGVIIRNDGGGVGTDGSTAGSDAGAMTGGSEDSGCGCRAASGSSIAWFVALLALVHRRRKRA